MRQFRILRIPSVAIGVPKRTPKKLASLSIALGEIRVIKIAAMKQTLPHPDPRKILTAEVNAVKLLA